jgi:1-phosphatidylinositol phosphodiesterase
MVRKNQHSYQMNSWDFESVIYPNQSKSIYIEWDQGILTTESDDSGEAAYEFEGTGKVIEFQARAKPFEIRVYFQNFETADSAKGTIISLGWKHDGNIDFQVSGNEHGFYIGAQKMSDWMSDVRDNRLISELSIPGTHDSCTYTTRIPYTRCQDLSLETQLNSGIRFMDIRCRHFNDTFCIHHGPVYLDKTFTDIRNICINFLSMHKNEFIILHIKPEYDAENNNKTFDVVLNEYIRGYESYFYTSSKVPTLKEAKGKIVLLCRYSDNSVGINVTPWKDDATFSIDSRFRVQDVYKVRAFFTEKSTYIKNLLEEAQKDTTGKFYLNFISGTNIESGFTAPAKIAVEQNSKLHTYLNDNRGKKKLGVVIMDFPFQELIRAIIDSNF